LTASRYDPEIGEWVELSGASSTDDGRVAYFLFDFGDGETAGWLADNLTSHSYAAKGSYSVRLKVQDDTGAESDWSPQLTIRVKGAPPVAVLSVRPASGDVRTSFFFSSLSYEVDGGLAEAVWSFGDGHSARGTQVNHSYRVHGDFSVSLTVKDSSGLSAQAFALVRVHDLGPMPAISLYRTSALVGEKVGFSANGTSDQDDPFANLTFIWNFGDGQKAAGAAAAYAFRNPGVYRVVLSASDGNQSAETATFVTVRSPVPVAAAPQGATWLSWVVLAALLGAMALLVIAMLLPDDGKRRRKRAEEEE